MSSMDKCPRCLAPITIDTPVIRQYACGTRWNKVTDEIDNINSETERQTNPKETTMQNQNETSRLLADRGRTPGSYICTANLAQELKFIMHHSDNWSRMNAVQKESIELICTKLARIGNGNHKEPDHWKDIAGYATLVVIELENQNPKLAGDDK